jgi:uncharacterized protein (UPF0332 family)
MNPKDFLTIASQLLISKKEPEYRTATNRAYYALFLSLREYLSSTYNISFTHNYAHTDVRSIARIGKMSIIAGALSDTSKKRNDADYEINKAFSFQDADDTYNEVDRILREPSLPPPTGISFDKTLNCYRIIEIYNESKYKKRRFLFIEPYCRKITTCSNEELKKYLKAITSMFVLLPPQISSFKTVANQKETWLYCKQGTTSNIYCHNTFVFDQPIETSHVSCQDLISKYINSLN